MGSEVLSACCCGQTGQCTLRPTVFGETIDTGCCHLEDSLILFCQRPGYSNEQWGTCGTGIDTEYHYRVTGASCDPIVALYKFYDCWYRVAYAFGGGAELLCNLPRQCSFPGCSGPPPSGTTFCEPLNQDWNFLSDPCCTQVLPQCQCQTLWYSLRQQAVIRDQDPRYPSPCRWLDEVVCHAGGNPICNGLSLYNQFLGVVFFERVWKVPDGQFGGGYCDPGVRVYIPPCDNCTDDYAPNPSTTVPYYIAYAGAGVPVFLCDLDDALKRGIITTQERTDLLNDLLAQVQPDQAILRKMQAYWTPGDYRDEQVAAWQELCTRFPGSGYCSCPTTACTMPMLGPFRKRCAPDVCTTGAQSCIRYSDMTDSAKALNSPCQYAYPGSCASQADYDYWAERQWTYWRGVPGGWAWGNWSVTPDEFKAGSGRNGLECMNGLRNMERCDPSCLSLACRPTATTCCGCTLTVPPQCTQCQVQGCSDTVDNFACLKVQPFTCSGLAAQPECYGVQFIGWQYYAETNLQRPPGQEVILKCLYNARSFLVGAQRSVQWDGVCPMSCVASNPPLGVFKNWPSFTPGALGEGVICGAISNGLPGYSLNNLCCGHHCPSFDNDNCGWWEELEGTTSTIRRPCAAVTACPTLTPQQEACIGFVPDCTP